MSKLIGFKADKNFQDNLQEFAEQYFQGNKSIVMKIAIEEFMDNYAAEGSSRFEKLEEDIQNLKSDILDIKNSIRGLLLKIEGEG